MPTQQPLGVRCHDALATMMLARASSCPSDHWLDILTPWLQAQAPTVYFNVGANKGFNTAQMFQRLTVANVTNAEWFRRLKVHNEKVKGVIKAKGVKNGRVTGAKLCGICRACGWKRTSNGSSSAPLAAPSALHAYAFEMLPSNAEWLRTAFRHFGIPVHLEHAVVSNVSAGAVDLPVDSPIGHEGHSASSILSPRPAGPRMIRVPTVSLDSVMRRERIAHAHFVSIDAEGHDALIMDGLRDALERGAVDLLEFEYHSVGFWAKDATGGRTLAATLAWLQHLSFFCYWEGKGGCIAPASPPCWFRTHEIRVMSNLVCVREGAHIPARKLRALSDRCSQTATGSRRPYGKLESGLGRWIR